MMLYPAMALLGISVGGFATTSALCSQVVPHALIGEAQGVLASMKSLMEGVGPLAFAWMLPRFEESAMPGAPWIVSAASMAVAFVLCFWLEAYTAEALHTHRGRSCCDCSDDDLSSSPLVSSSPYPTCKQSHRSPSTAPQGLDSTAELAQGCSDDETERVQQTRSSRA